MVVNITVTVVDPIYYGSKYYIKEYCKKFLQNNTPEGQKEEIFALQHKEKIKFLRHVSSPKTIMTIVQRR